MCRLDRTVGTTKFYEVFFVSLWRYDERIDRVESRITARLRDQLGQAKSANEMFRIFSRFNALFVRPHIRGAIREYQNQLIHRVKEDIEKLHEKFKAGLNANCLAINNRLLLIAFYSRVLIPNNEERQTLF